MANLSGPPRDLLIEAGLDPRWSRFVNVPTRGGETVTWHVLDTGTTTETTGTLVCVHGNPTWSYLFADLLRTLSPQWRVIAIDQTSMGYSERTGPRKLQERIDELVAFCRQEVTSPLSFAAHDWGGPVAVGACAELHVEALILANTAVSQPPTVKVPPLITLSRRLVDLVCRRTPLFVRGTARMGRPEHRRFLRAPYRGVGRRRAVADFVVDIPVEPSHPSRGALDHVAATFSSLQVPILLLWGAKDMVFHDRFLADLRQRQPFATVERFEDASHLVLLDGEVGPVVRRWLTSLTTSEADPSDVRGEDNGTDDAPFATAFTAVERNALRDEVLYDGPDGTLTWRELAKQARTAASALGHSRIGLGDRVALLIPPSPQLLISVVALWQVGAVPVVVDPSSGPRALRRQLRAQAPRAVLGTRTSLIAATVLRWTPGALPMGFVRLPGVVNLSLPRPEVATTRVHADDVAAIVHTSGATGPAKAVVYTHGALVAQRSPMDALLGDHTTGAFTTSFAGFSLLAPALQRPYVRPNVAIGEPSKLGFDELHELTVKRSIHVAWLSPASARQLVATANKRTLPLRTMLLAGAPISPELARAVGEVTNGTVLAPYGMTECLPITSGEGAQEIHPSGGVIVGSPLHHATVRLRNLATGELVAHPSDLGEILVHAPWMYTTYDQRYEANEEATLTIDGVRFHATGDVGLFDQENLVVLGRRRDVLHTVNGPVPPLAIEGPVGRALGRDVAVVGVGPTGAQVAAVVVHSSNTRLALAPPELAEAVRDAAPLPIAAVMTKRLPVDHRHQSKVDHLALRNSVEAFLTES